ncbi:MAG: HPF/RaiA family ribosome-associated protein [Phycisphaeraceae bacterium]
MLRFAISSRRMKLTEPIRQHLCDRLAAALDRHEAHVRCVDVTLADTNGPKGGVDKDCQVTVHLRRGGIVRVRETGEDLYATVSHAADKVKRSAGRLLNRRRWPRSTRASGLAGT